MPDTSFDLAPAVKTVDGLVSVPIDIQQVAASLVFDGTARCGTGDALNYRGRIGATPDSP